MCSKREIIKEPSDFPTCSRKLLCILLEMISQFTDCHIKRNRRFGKKNWSFCSQKSEFWSCLLSLERFSHCYLQHQTVRNGRMICSDVFIFLASFCLIQLSFSIHHYEFNNFRHDAFLRPGITTCDTPSANITRKNVKIPHWNTKSLSDSWNEWRCMGVIGILSQSLICTWTSSSYNMNQKRLLWFHSLV